MQSKYENKSSITYSTAGELWKEIEEKQLLIDFGAFNKRNFPIDYAQHNADSTEDLAYFHKAILFALHHHIIEYHQNGDTEVCLSREYKPFLQFIPLADHKKEDVDKEAEAILGIHNYINSRMLIRAKTHAPDTEITVMTNLQHLTQIKIFAPYKFKPEALPIMLAGPGVITIRLHNGWIMPANKTYPSRCGFYTQFGAYNFRHHLPPPTPSTTPRKRQRSVTFAEPCVSEVIEPGHGTEPLPPI